MWWSVGVKETSRSCRSLRNIEDVASMLGFSLSLNELGTKSRIIGVALFRPAIKGRFIRRVEWCVQLEALGKVGVCNEQPTKRHRISQILRQGLCRRRAIEAVDDNQRAMELLPQLHQGHGHRAVT